MSTDFDISIVISSYNRDNKVLQTVQRLFESDFNGFKKVEVIVIDDGSPSPVEKLLQQVNNTPGNIEWRVITQSNAGIGATRNRGYREAKAPLILFLDDDIILKKDSVQQLCAAVKEGKAVVFGSYPFISHRSVALEKFARRLFNYDAITTERNFIKVDAITSGLLCVDKAALPGLQDFYRDDLSVPAAEEHELIYRFHREGIDIWQATHIAALHNHHLTLSWLVQQQYKYGLATAEAISKKPEIAGMEKFARLKKTMEKPAGKAIKQLLATAFIRNLLLTLSRAAEKLAPEATHSKLFGVLTSAYFRAGYNTGIKKFKI